jgi:hypothetical protein
MTDFVMNRQSQYELVSQIPKEVLLDEIYMHFINYEAQIDKLSSEV